MATFDKALIVTALTASLAACTSDGGAMDDGGGSESSGPGGSSMGDAADAGTDTGSDGGTTDGDGPADTGTAADAGTDAGVDGSTGTGTDGDCVPVTCAEMAYDCGTIYDGCGGTEDCGSCTEPATCGHFEEKVCGCEQTEWVIEHVAFMDDIGQFTNLAEDSEGSLHIVHYDNTNHNLRYATRTAGGTWSDSVLDPTSQVGTDASMAIDADDGLHVSYYDGSNDELRYAYKPAGGDWSYESTGVTGGRGSDIAVGDDGTVHIAHSTGNRVSWYTYGTAGDWASEQAAGVVGAHGGTYRSGIALDSEGLPHICVGGETLNGTSGELSARRLVYATRSTIGAWTSEELEGAYGTGNFVGVNCDIAVDATDTVHIVHYDTGNGDLRYISNPMAPYGTWTAEVIDSDGDVGRDPSIEVDELGTLHVAYYDATNEYLDRAIKPLGGTWETMLLTAGTGLPTEGQVGVYSDLLVESSTSLHVAYYEGLSDDLYYAHLDVCPIQ